MGIDLIGLRDHQIARVRKLVRDRHIAALSRGGLTASAASGGTLAQAFLARQGRFPVACNFFLRYGFAMKRDTGLAQAIAAAGSSDALGALLGITGQAVRQWDRVPAERLPEIERVTGLPRHILRPDIVPPPVAT